MRFRKKYLKQIQPRFEEMFLWGIFSLVIDQYDFQVLVAKVRKRIDLISTKQNGFIYVRRF